MKYWIKGKNGLSEKKIFDTFSVLGYDVSMREYIFASDDDDSSDGRIYYTWDGDNTVHKVYKSSSIERVETECEMVERLIELDKDFIELKPDEIITDPKFKNDDVIYDTHKAYRRAIVTSVNRKEQKYKVKDFNNAEYYIKFLEQDGWNFVLRPAFDEETMITDGANRIYIIDIEFQWQRYKVCIDGDDDTFYIDFKEQDNFRRVGFNEPL